MSKTVDGKTTEHVWDGNKQIVADVKTGQYYDADCYLRGTNLVATYSYTNGNKSGYTYYTQNAHGDVVNLTDADGEVVKSYTYDAFGVEKNIDDADTNAFRYCGEYYDAETGTIYLRARYYNPTTGRFISRDSYAGKVSDPLSLNLYTYCYNNPLRYVDPSGHYGVLPDGTHFTINSAWDAKKFYELRDEQRANALVSKKQIESINCLGTKWADISNESVDELNRALKKYDITEEWEIIHFISQVTLETGYGKNLVEDTDGKYLEPGTNAGNNVGNTEIGDGFKYRGGGYMQLTGRENYGRFANAIGNDRILSEGCEYVATHYAWESAAWYWRYRVADEIDENSTVEEVTYCVNGGYR